MYSFKLALSLCFANALAIRAVKNITVDDFDPRIVYSNPSVWRHESVSTRLLAFLVSVQMSADY